VSSGPGPWQILESSWLYRSSFLGLRRDRCRLPDGRLSPDYFFLEIRDAAIVVAVTPGGGVLLVREYRHGTGDVTPTLPAGFIDPGEAPADAARRELAEETGYAGAPPEPLGAFFVLPGLSSMTVHAFLVRAAVPAGDRHLDEFEQIEVVTVPLEELAREHRGGPRRTLRDVSSALAFALALDRLGTSNVNVGSGSAIDI
jgi:8-oxo-dGTP pyrophosphatase MutT (NUDIX family)